MAMESREKNRMSWVLAGLPGLIALGTVVVQSGGVHGASQLPGWLGSSVRRKIFPEQYGAGLIHDELAKAPVALATLVGQFRVAWPGEGVAAVHSAAMEVAADLLHQGDVQVGDLEAGKFVPWPIKPWAAEEKIRAELLAQPGFYANDRQIVFRRKPAPTS
jgi:hypothetical protein